MRRRLIPFLVIAGVVSAFVLPGTGAIADHSNPRTRLSPTDSLPASGAIINGVGSWSHIRNFRPNPGSDLEFFTVRGATYASTGTLGQANAQHVGQRIIQLLDRNGNLNVRWVADHGSSACPTGNTSATGLQHDPQIASIPKTKPRLMIDTTDAASRCHDPNGGGLEIVDVTGIHKDGFQPRELALIRFAGFSHTHTVDTRRPWIVYNSSSDFAGRPWIEVVDLRSCFKRRGKTLEEQRATCKPRVHRIPFQPEWSQKTVAPGSDEQVPDSSAACHDITSEGTRLYCASLNATLIFDVSDLVKGKPGKRWVKGKKKGKGGKKSALAKPNNKKKKKRGKGKVRGQALDCRLIAGTRTYAMVTDCSGAVPPANSDPAPGPRAQGWAFLGGFNHVGRDCTPGPGIDNGSPCNTNVDWGPEEDVSVSHEADPTWDGNYVFVTDERGGGVVPPGATCSAALPNPQGNGGAHVFDIRDPANIDWAPASGGGPGSKAVFIGEPYAPAPTFCDIHVIEKIPGEQRFVVAYYSQGTKIVDYWVEPDGEIQFRETASVIWPNANTWATEDFKIVDNPDGTRTYYFLSTDIQRGIDVHSWTGPTNPIGSAPPPRESALSTEAANAGLLGLAVLGLPIAAAIGRRRRRRV
jgi:hypothetical protein